VETSAAITASLPGRYASALFALAKEQRCEVSVEQDLDTLGAALAESTDFAALIRDPSIGRDAAGAAVDGVANVLGNGPMTRNFLGVLAQNGRLTALPAAIRAFSAIAAADRGEVAADVTTAHPLDDAQLADLAARLREREGQDVKITAKVDPDLLGGLVVRIGSRQIDSSIRTRLNTLARAIRG